ncbi:jg10182 [Pararge aegeria aegeria]|uniref:Jg10182 protein n=1 Tax=Pararge aegeria aegeria TaxID=348720 RepID=A0A8S4S546_9NEOP|nr:jg10182 [Pararge aegeria aegeria]
MGTVHAKAEQNSDKGAVGSGIFEFEEPDTFEEPAPKPAVKLNGVRARVDRVHVDGLSRTKDDVIKSTIDDLFHATDFEDVIFRAHKVRRALDSMGCFRDIGVFIDVSKGPEATPEGLEVTFHVKELSRIVGGINTTTKHNLQWEGIVRDTSVLSKTTSFKVRESSGPQMKSVIRHIVTVDHRDEPIFPTRGTWVQFSSELAGLGGSVANVRTELQAQANKEVAPGFVSNTCGTIQLEWQGVHSWDGSFKVLEYKERSVTC